MTRLDWRGAAVSAALLEAARAAIDETTEAAAQQAASATPRNTGRLAGEVRSEPAVVQGRRVTGKFGTSQRRGFYGLFVERRRPFLRPAADGVFPTLAGRIRGRMK